VEPLDKLSQVVDKLIKAVGDLNKSLDKTSDKANRAANAVKGDGKLGKGKLSQMDGALASFSGFSDRDFLKVRNMLAGSMPTGTANVVTGLIGNSPKILGGFNSMMPDLGATFSRASTYYDARVASGGRLSREQLQRATMNGIGANNQTGIGSDAATAAYLAGRGMVVGSATFTQTLKTVGGMAQSMNMSNQAAAAAVEGFTSGVGSANLLKNFGIYTSDSTGKAMGTQEIVAQIKGRLTAGRGKYTTADVQESLRRGALGVTLQNSGLSQDQQAMVVQSLMGDATDSKTGPIDFNDPKSMDRAAKAMGGNPNAPFMKIYGAKNSAMTKAEGAYGVGADAAANALVALNSAAGDLASTFGALNAAAGTFMGDNAGSGVMSVLGGAANVGMMAMMARGGGLGAAPLGGMLGKMGPAMKKAGPMMGKFAAGAGILYGGSQVVSGSMSAYEKGQTGQEMTSADWMGAGLNGAILGASIGSIIPGVGTAVGLGVGALIGAGAGLLSAGVANSAGTADMTGGGGPEKQAATGVTAAAGNKQRQVGNSGRLSLIPPVNGKLGDRFGTMASYRDTPHRGQDWSVGEGTNVKACAAGEVIATNTSNELGRMVQIKHEGGWITQYCHLSNNSIKNVGDKVSQGDYIANSGNTGTATTGPHLHLALMKGGKYYDPMLYMSGASQPAPTSTDGSTSGASASRADAGVSSTDPVPIANAGSNAVSTGTSGVSGSSANIADQINSSGAGGGGEGTDPNVGLRNLRSGIDDHVNGGGKSKNNVTINVSIAKADEASARKFAQQVKQFLEDDRRLSSIGAN
jgi:hypothetical protein